MNNIAAERCLSEEWKKGMGFFGGRRIQLELSENQMLFYEDDR